MAARRPVSILIGALGGHGGGVLTEWIVGAAAHAGYPAQSTSIPGVAQRTGATTYYVEIFPERAESGPEPVFSLYPTPGDVDVIVASELLEASKMDGAGAFKCEGLGIALIRREYQARFGLQWMDPLGVNNTFAMVIRESDARKHNVVTLSDAARYAPGWTLGVGYEFQQRPDGLAGLLKTYQLPLHGTPKTMDLGLLYKALEQGQVSMVAGNATDGQLSVLNAVVLQDDRHYFPPYDCGLVVRPEILKDHPALQQALGELVGRFSNQTMRKLNHQVDGEHRPVREVAEQFLREAGLLLR